MKRIAGAILLSLASLAFAEISSTAPTTLPADLQPATQAVLPTTVATSAPSSAPTTASAPVAAYVSPPPRIVPTPLLPVAPALAVFKPVGRPMTRDFSVLLMRSIFLRGNQNVSSTSDSDIPVTTSVATVSTQPTTQPGTPLENSLVFNGVSDVNGQLVAFVENASAGTITQLHLGDAIAQGKIVSINLDAIDYQSGANVIHVQIGQNLSGVDSRVSTTQPVTTVGPSTGNPAVDDVLERLRRRRQQELGGK